jgi:hypothetical protein
MAKKVFRWIKFILDTNPEQAAGTKPKKAAKEITKTSQIGTKREETEQRL